MHNVLIAEDEPFLLKMYKFNMEREGFRIELARDGAEALAAMERSRPDILLLDLLMPNVDGYSVLEEVRKRGYDFPIVVLSNLTQDLDHDRLRDAKLADFFIKSDMDLPELIERVKEILASDEKAVPA